MEQLPVFVYGTLRRGQSNYRLLAGRTCVEFPARVAGLALVGHGIPFAIERPGSVVVGELMAIEASHYTDVLRDLDRLEGFRPQRPDTSLYVRITREVEVLDDNGLWKPRAAHLYLGGHCASQFTEEDLIPGGDWVASYAA